MSVRRTEAPDPNAAAIRSAAREAIVQARTSGTGLIGDVSNTLVTVDLLRDAQMPAHVFYEQLGFNLIDVAAKIAAAVAAMNAVTDDDATVRVTLAAHAPYSVSPALFAAIRREVDASPHPVTTVHLGESAQEVEFVRDGTGPARVMLEQLGVWTDAWTPPGTSPVAYLDDLQFIDARTLVVHGVQFTSEDLDRLRRRGATLVSCPRSNVYVGAGSPPLASFYDAAVNVAFGTDSLASVADLHMFNELAEARRIAPRVAARRLLESATLAASRALGFDRELGSIEVGKRAALLSVRVPRDVDDVEEYLVGGVEPAAIEWLNLSTPD
jgi:cytosine/adenosine deaminase-related metal-dependent hydrolase